MNQTKQNNISHALITGAASGIGKAIALALAAKGFHIIALDKDEAGLVLLRQTIDTQYNVGCYVFKVDLSHPIETAAVLKEILQQPYSILVLINNAGVLHFDEITELSPEKIRNVVELHIHTMVQFCNAIGSKMKQQNTGYILNVSSIASVMPYPGISLYGPSKTFIRYFTKALRTELSPYQIKVTCLIPGATATNLYDPNKVDYSKAMRWGIMHSAESVAHKAIQDLFSNKAESVPGLINKIILLIFPLIPAFLIRFIYSKTNTMKHFKAMLSH